MIARVLKYLEAAEAAETDPAYQDSYRLAWITLSLAYQDQPFPFVLAHYRMFGCHPEKLAGKVEAMRRAKLGNLYDLFYPPALPPKKPSLVATTLARRTVGE